MTTELTNEEKIDIIDQRIKSLNHTLYGYEVELIQTNAGANIKAEQIAYINSRISDINDQKAALEALKVPLTNNPS